jgi:hypothetical protein
MAISSALGTGSLTPGVCTSTTRPTAPFEGQMIYETDTDLVRVWSGSAWVEVSSMLTKAPRGVMASVVRTTSVSSLTTSTADITGMTVTFTAESTRLYKFTWTVTGQKIANAGFTEIILTNAANTQFATVVSTVNASGYWNCSGCVLLTSLNGSVTYKLRGLSGTGGSNIVAQANGPITFVVEDIGSV